MARPAVNSRLRRRGFALLLVLALVPVLALGGYTFTHVMRAEARAARAAAREAQTRWLADAGVQHALALLVDKSRMIPGEFELQDNAAAFAGVAVPGGSALAIYSRARYGIRDFGVNQKRVERWLAALPKA